MARIASGQVTFARGLLGEKLHDRGDLEMYYSALADCTNYVVDGKGILEKRPGTRYAGATKANGAAWLIPFVYDLNQSYMLEFGNGYVRPWANYGQVLDGLVPSETATPFTAEEAEQLGFLQDRDIMFLVQENHAPARLARVTANTFTLNDFDTYDGPYLDLNGRADWTLGVEQAAAGNATTGVVTIKTAANAAAVPTDMRVGSVILIWDGIATRKMTVKSLDRTAGTVTTDYTGPSAALTTQWSYDGKAPPVLTNTAAIGGVDMGTSSPILTAVGAGHEPFTAGMVGRWVRILTQFPDAPEDADLGERFRWDFFQIVEFIDSTHVTVDYEGPSIAQTADFRLGAFWEGNWPTAIALHGGRLALGLRNRVFLSRPADYTSFSPSDSDSTVLPNHAITVGFDASLSGNGTISKINWLKSLGAQLVIGSASGIFTVESSNFGEALKPDTAGPRAQDSRGASAVLPVIVGDAIIFASPTGKQLMGTYYAQSPQGGLKIKAQNLSNVADELTLPGLRQLAWQDEPHSIVWQCRQDGGLIGITLEPEEKIQAWHVHRLGGRYVENGRVMPTRVESVAVMPSPDGLRKDLWMIATRTINGQTVRYVEVLAPYWEKGADTRGAWYVDAGLAYSGNTDPAKSIDFVGVGPNTPWTFTTNFASPAFAVGDRLSFFDGKRWHRGTVMTIGGTNDGTWLPSSPNAAPGPADGLRWFWDGATWTQSATRFDPVSPTYEEPNGRLGITAWSRGLESIGGAGHLEGSAATALIDGTPVKGLEVSAGSVAWNSPAAVVTLGLPYDSTGSLLSLQVGAQAGSSADKQRPVYEMAVNVFETWGLEVGTGVLSGSRRQWAYYEPLVFPHSIAEGEPVPLVAGRFRSQRDEQGDVTDPKVAWRHSEPLPCFIRSVLVRLSASDGR